MALATALRTLKPFAAATAALGFLLAIVGIIVHLLMAHEYQLNVAERLVILAHNAEEAVESIPRRAPVEPALARVLNSPDEGVAWIDARGRIIAKSGMTATRNAAIENTRLDKRDVGSSIRATISNGRVPTLLHQLDLGLAIGIVFATLLGGFIIGTISARAIARIEAAFDRVYRFTGDAAHELRTPLAVIANNADRLAFESTDDAGRERNLANIRTATSQMSELMEGLLLLARADDGVAQSLHAIDIGTSLEALVQTYRSEAAGRDLRLLVRAAPNVTIYGVPEQVARIVGNLIENALRHTPPGGLIEVSMTTERGAVLIEVADTGTGIAPEALGRIFDRFWRGAGPHAEGGAGLGLAIARGLARAHGGDVRVRSGLGTGSTFTIRLPLRLRRISGPSTVS